MEGRRSSPAGKPSAEKWRDGLVDRARNSRTLRNRVRAGVASRDPVSPPDIQPNHGRHLSDLSPGPSAIFRTRAPGRAPFARVQAQSRLRQLSRRRGHHRDDAHRECHRRRHAGRRPRRVAALRRGAAVRDRGSRRRSCHSVRRHPAAGGQLLAAHREALPFRLRQLRFLDGAPVSRDSRPRRDADNHRRAARAAGPRLSGLHGRPPLHQFHVLAAIVHARGAGGRGGVAREQGPGAQPQGSAAHWNAHFIAVPLSFRFGWSFCFS